MSVVRAGHGTSTDPMGGAGESRGGVPRPDAHVLERNLLMLTLRSSATAAKVRSAAARGDASFEVAPDGSVTGTIDSPAAIDSFTLEVPRHRLASRHRPIAEAAALADTIDPRGTAAVVVMGFGMGHHVRLLAERVREHGIVIVFEPDAGLLRAVLERVDCSAWLSRGNVVVLTDAKDVAAIANAVKRCETLLSLGTRILSHPPSLARLGPLAGEFGSAFAEVMRGVRTTVVTTLVQSETTLRNLLQNADHYACDPGIADLAGRYKGRPAIVVAAGPSLARNIDLLVDPRVRERFVIIVAQTVLKTLLSRGIKPHFVTALDHHEISKRFYEGLTEEMVRGVTLVAEPKANPAILDAFPGLVRCAGDDILDEILGKDLARERGRIPPGATVAHLSYYLARYLGCDPVALVGQDLGFTDGQYYAAHAAIHDVWGAELSEFRTLEMFEWERIVRMRGQLHRATDQLGRSIYTDEQMAAYLMQFERDFANDAQRGLTTLDATEGGIAKRGTRAVPLREVIERFGKGDRVEPDPGAFVPAANRKTPALRKTEDRLREVRKEVWRFGEHARSTRDLIDEALAHFEDRRRVDGLIRRIHAVRDEVHGMKAAGWLVHFVNQTGSLRRVREDRAIELDESLSPLEKQRRQLVRDRDNVSWLADAADFTGTLLDDALRSLAGGPKVTRDADAPRSEGAAAPSARRRVVGVMAVLPSTSALGFARDVHAPLANGRSVLQTSLERAGRCRELDRIVVLTPDVARVEQALGEVRVERPVDVLPLDAMLVKRHTAACRGARAWARSSWRGGLGNLSAFDEALCPFVIAPALASVGANAVVPLSPDWVLLDPSLVDAAIARHRESPERLRLTFAPAPAGLASCVLDRELLEELARSPSPFSSVGGLLGYIPISPQMDPIAKPACVSIEPAVRDLGVRFAVDGGCSLARWRTFLEASPGADRLDARVLASLSRDRGFPPAAMPEVLEVRLFDDEGRPADGALLARLAEELRSAGETVVTLAGAPTIRGGQDTLAHPDLVAIVAGFRRGGCPVHVRTGLACDAAWIDALLDMDLDVVSVDVHATTPETYRTLTGRDDLERVLGNTERLVAARDRHDGPGLPATWIVPRLTRRDATYAQIEGFYDHALMRCGAAVLDPLPAPIPGERIAPLPVPRSAAARLRRTAARVAADGSVFSGDHWPIGSVGGASLRKIWSQWIASIAHEQP